MNTPALIRSNLLQFILITLCSLLIYIGRIGPALDSGSLAFDLNQQKCDSECDCSREWCREQGEVLLGFDISRKLDNLEHPGEK